MKYFDHKIIKTALGTAISIYLADLLDINFGVTAGIITIITIQGTKKESIKVAIERFVASLVGLCIAVLLFNTIGFSSLVFGIFVLIFMPICIQFNLFQGFLATVVLVTHMLVIKDVSLDSVANEFKILLLGTVVALVLNMYMPYVKEDIVKVQMEIDEGMKRIFNYFGEVLITGAIFIDEETVFNKLKGNVDLYRNLAFKEYNNDLFNPSTYELDMANMKRSQYKVLVRMRGHFYRFYISSEHAHLVADFARHVANTIGKDDEHENVLKELVVVREKFGNMPLPQSRVEFESRAIFFQFLNDIEEFLEIKKDFLKKYDTVVYGKKKTKKQK